MSDLDIIKELEEEIGQNIWEVPGEGYSRYKDSGCAFSSSNNKVTHLTFRKMNMQVFPASILKLKNLTYFSIRQSEPIELPPIIGELSNLTSLILVHNQFTSLPPEIGKLSKLVTLVLSNNRLTSLPPEIGKLTNLYSLFLQENELTNLPPEIGKLSKLLTLRLNDNNLESLPAEVWQLSELRTVLLGNNRLVNIPPEVRQLTRLTQLSLYNNILETPPKEIAEQGISAINNYFDQIEKEQGQTQFLFESKLLIIGDGATGKTTFRQKIVDPECDLPNDEDTTRGIEVDKWQFPTQHTHDGKRSEVQFHVNLWDFGGQELYRGTHQMFFSEKSYYVLVADTRKQATDYSYWLNTILQLAGEDCSVLILLNKKHGHEIKFDEKGYKGHFGKIIKHVVSIDLDKEIDGVHNLREQIKLHLKQLPGIGDRLPPSWVQIREDLAKETSKFISFDRFREICKDYDIIDSGVIKTLSVYYSRIGVFTHYIDEPLLMDRVYLDSDWLMDTVYEILENEEVSENAGRLTTSDIERIWKENRLDFEVNRLAALMDKFGLMYQVGNTGNYVVPEHLPGGQPYVAWPHEGTVLHFVYEFNKYMPHGLMSRLIVALHRHIKDHELVWHQGVNIELDNTYAEITESYGAESSFKIRIVGEHKIELLSVIREHFEEILDPFRNLQYDQLVPCICEDCEGADPPEFHKYNDLQKQSVRWNGSQCTRSGRLISVEDLLRITILKKSVESIGRQVDTTKLKTIQLFLASSMELEGDRREVEIWVARENKRLVKKGVYLQLNIWEDFLDAMSKTRLQDEYNKALLDSEVVICLFATKIGMFTREEFETAYLSFTDGKKPYFLYTFFKSVQIDTSDLSNLEGLVQLKKFKDELSDLGHFPTPYKSTEDLIRQLGSQLARILEKLS